MAPVNVMKHGEKGERVRQLQAATNKRLRARDLHALCVKEDGVLGVKSIEAVAKAAWALGALEVTVDRIRHDRDIPLGVRRLVRNPGRRNDRQKAAATARMSQMRAARKRRADAVKKDGARGKAVNAFLARVGTVEHPAGSNGGPLISDMQAYWGFGRVPWCGVAEGYFAKVYGGVDGLRSDVASVSAIEQHARRGDAPYGKWVSDVSGLLQGSFLVIGGSGIHTEMKVENAPGGATITVGGNTSFGPGGSQSNGGCIARRIRSDAEVYGGASMNYPGA